MGSALCVREWAQLMEDTEAFSLVLPANPFQPKVVIILSDARMIFRSEDLDEIVETWREKP